MNIKYQTYFILLLLSTMLFGGEKLYVFYPTTVRPHILQKKLSEACPEIEITVFGRYKDFMAQVAVNYPNAILVKPDLLQQLPLYKKILSGIKNEKLDGPYSLVSVERKIDTDSIGNITIGTVDFLGRKGMNDLLSTFFTNPPKVKRVTKTEDMLPLLRFNMVTALFLCVDDLEYLQEKSKLNFVITNLPEARVGGVAIAFKNEITSPLIFKSVKGFSKELNSIFDIDGWKK